MCVYSRIQLFYLWIFIYLLKAKKNVFYTKAHIIFEVALFVTATHRIQPTTSMSVDHFWSTPIMECYSVIKGNGLLINAKSELISK